MVEAAVRADMAYLAARMENRLAKYRRNFNRYTNNGRRVEDIRQMYSNPLSFYAEMGDDTGLTPNENIIREAINTHVSKLSQTKVRPFFNPVVGTWRTRKVCRNAQIFFDEYFEMQRVYIKAQQAIKYADIFEFGALWVNEETHKIEKVAPWEFLYDQPEFHYEQKFSRVVIIRKQYPLIRLKEKLGDNPNLKESLDQNRGTQVEYAIYYDLIDKQRWEFADAKLLKGYPKEIDFEVSPVVTLFIEEPLKGGYSTSMADNLYTIQSQVDVLCQRIHLALELSPANAIFTPKGSEIKASQFSNEIGAFYEYMPIPEVTHPPVIVSTPAPIDQEYRTWLQYWKQAAFEQEGISQLSAQAKKPSGLNSGVALQTLEDVESERHNPALVLYIDFLMRVAKTCIEVYPENEDILPPRSGRADITWKDIKKERESYNIQFSASSALSKDPMVKMQQIEKLLGMRIIDQSLASSLLDMPDLEAAYDINAASYDDTQKIIERAAEKGDLNYYEVVNLQQLYAQTANTLLRLDAHDEKADVLDNLVKLLHKVKGDMDAVNAAMTPPPQPVGPGEQPGPTGPGAMPAPQAPGPTGPLPVQPGPAPGPQGP
jgi:hypothetical protein